MDNTETALLFQLKKEEARARIEHEDHLVNHRMSWLVGSQSFLFAADVVLVNGPIYSGIQGTSPYVDIASSLLYFIPLIGIVIGVCSFVGVLAAFFAIRAWKYSVSNQGERSTLTSRTKIAHLGGVASVMPAPIIASIWSLLLYEEHDQIAGLPHYIVIVPLGVGAATAMVWVCFNWRLFISSRD